MSDFFSLRSALIRLFILSSLSLAGLSVSAVPIPPPGVPLFTDPQFQACFDELTLANGWTLTEEVTSLACPDRNIESLDGLQHFTNLIELDLSGNRILASYPIEQLPQLEVLDLSNNKLFDVFSLQPLRNLRQLNLSANSKLQPFEVKNIIQWNPALTHIGVAGIAMGDLDWLPSLNLQELDISDTGTFNDLTPLAQYSNLRVLKAAGNEIINVWPLDLLMQLEVLDLSNNNLDDVTQLQWLHHLKQLNLSFNSKLELFQVLNIVQGNPGLTHIGVAGITMDDLSWLPPMGPQGEYNLLELDISDTGSFIDLVPVTQYSNLRVLKAAGNQIVDTWPQGQLAQLEVLDLSDNKLRDVYPLQVLHDLRSLNLSNNSALQPFDVQNIIQLNPGLAHIGVAGIAMGDLSWLPPVGPQGEFNLQELDISDTGIFPDLSPVTQYTQLRLLKAAGNRLQTAWPLDQLAQLEVLDLSNNKLGDIYPLQVLHDLKQLNLSANSALQPIEVQNIIQGNPGLTHIGVAGIAMGDLSWLPPRGPQGEYNLLELDISDTGTLPDLVHLAQYPDLRVLKAADNQIVNASVLDSLMQLEVLDLSNNKLGDSFPPQWSHNLKQLNLSGNSTLQAIEVQNIIQGNPGLTHIGVAGIAMGDLSWLPPRGPQGEYNLLELDISDTGTFIDLSPVTQYSNLRVLKAAGNQLQTAGPLQSLARLEILDLSNNQLLDVYTLEMLHHLTQLNLSANSRLQPFEVKNVINGNPGLTHIGVAGIAMGDLNWLPPMGLQGEYNLLELDISDTGSFPDLAPVAQYINLRVLKAAGNQIVNTWPTGQLPQLEVLDLSNNQLLDVYPLQMLNDLKQLNLSANSKLQAFDVQNIIQGNFGLTHLGVAGIAMGDLSWLPPVGPQGEFNLVELDISDTGIVTDLAPVAQYINLRVLKAAGNQIADAWPVGSLAQLEVLDLSNNKLGDVTTLQWLQNLKQLNLSNNKPFDIYSPVIDLDILNQIIAANPGLTHLGVAGVAIGDLSQLAIFNNPYSALPYAMVELDVSNTGLIGLLPLSSIQSLRILRASSNNIPGSSGLEQLPQLQVLDLSHNSLNEISALQTLNTLTELNLTGNSLLQVLDIHIVILSNPALTHIGVGGIAMGDLNWLPPVGPQGEFNLQELDISSTGVFFDPNYLAQYQNLEVLRASGNAIEKIWSFEQLQLLEVLDLSNNRLSDINSLKTLHNLRELNVSGNVPAPFTTGVDLNSVNQVIEMNPGLTHLGVGGVQIGQLDQLAIFNPINGISDYLLELDISNTGILDLSAVAGLPNLRVLNASANQLVDALPLVQLQKLVVIDLSDNDIRSVLPLADIVNLSLLDLRGNNNIQCAELDELEMRLLPGVLLRPVSCIVMTPPTLAIVSPTGVGTFYSTSSIDFVANAMDDEDGNLDAQIQWTSSLLGPIGTGASFTSALSAGEHIITVAVTDSDGNTSSTSVNISVLYNTAPELVIQSIQNGAVFNEGETVVLLADANDVEEGDLDFAMQWQSSLDGFLGSGANIQLPLSIGNHTITASITDSMGATTTQSVNVSVNSLPQLSLQSPLNASTYQQGDNISFMASASDLEDGVLDAAIQWSSSLDGLLGSGANIQLPLSVGNHTITASITDSMGATTTQIVSVSVNGLPQLSLQSPLNASIYQQGDNISFIASASDQEDGVLDAAIQWSSSLDGSLGVGAQLSQSLNVGNHVITASITDSAGATVTQTATVNVNSLPQLNLLSPLNGSLFMLQESVKLFATANDVEDGDISVNIQWSSSLDGFLGAGGTLMRNLSLGEHTLTASITDSNGGSHALTTQVIIDQIQLGVVVSGNGRKRFAELTWSGSRTAVDIYQNGNLVGTGAANGSVTYRFKDQAVFRVCEAATSYCSIDVLAQ